MQLKNFLLSSDGISLDWQGHDLDLHNCFDFERLAYNLPLRQIEASWLRSPEEWAKGTVLPGLTLLSTRW